jgi:hypothetical protein
VSVKVSPEILTKVAERAQLEYIYEHALGQLQIELGKMQESIKAKGLKVAVLFEGRDAAGKGGCISRIASAMSPRICRVVALSAPNEREKTQCVPIQDVCDPFARAYAFASAGGTSSDTCSTCRARASWCCSTAAGTTARAWSE